MQCEIRQPQPSGRLIVAITASSFLLGAMFQAELTAFDRPQTCAPAPKIMEPVVHFDMPRIEESPGEWICDFGFRPILMSFAFHQCVLLP